MAELHPRAESEPDNLVLHARDVHCHGNRNHADPADRARRGTPTVRLHPCLSWTVTEHEPCVSRAAAGQRVSIDL